MKKFSNRKMESVLLIEKDDIDDIVSKIRGEHVNYIIAPIELKDNEQFLKQVNSNISIGNIYWGQILYYK